MDQEIKQALDAMEARIEARLKCFDAKLQYLEVDLRLRLLEAELPLLRRKADDKLLDNPPSA